MYTWYEFTNVDVQRYSWILWQLIGFENRIIQMAGFSHTKSVSV